VTGHAEVARLQKQLDATFKRIEGLYSSPDLEVQSDFARYLCVLVSGYLEKALAELALEHARRNGGITLQRFVEAQTQRFANANCQKILDLVSGFDLDWRRDLAGFFSDETEVKDAIDSVVNLRNRIAHGTPVAVTYQRIHDYYVCVKRAVDRIAEILGVV
jgi:hypothetical protein